MPSILIEIGFISNNEEQTYMLSPRKSKGNCSKYFHCVKKYKEKLEEKAAKSSDDKEKSV